MNGILIAILLVTAIGLIAGVGLAIASVVMAVPRDEKAAAIEEILPGANCGACGFSGCSGYDAALSKGEAKPGLCSPGGNETAQAIAAILGSGEVSVEPKSALVRCAGTKENAAEKMEYFGKKSCSSAILLHGGAKQCQNGCLGFGDCQAVCEFDAISICNGVAVVNPALCRACGKCVAACPKKLIDIFPVKQQAVVLCSNCDKGAEARKACKVACIGCMKCVKTCPEQAIRVENFHAIVDPEKCTGCGSCVEQCPQSCISLCFCPPKS